MTSIKCGKYNASLVLAYKTVKYFGLSSEEVFDFSEVEEIYMKNYKLVLKKRIMIFVGLIILTVILEIYNLDNV